MRVIVTDAAGKEIDPARARTAIWEYVKALIEAGHPGVRVELKGGERSEIRTEKKVG